MGRTLTLKKYEVVDVQYQDLGAFRLRVEASDPDGSGADANVFLHQRCPPNPYDGSVDDVFIAIASAADMAEYPVGGPNGQTNFPFFRQDWFEIDLRSLGLLQEVWVTTCREVAGLLLAQDRLEALTPTAIVQVGGGWPPAAGSGSSAAVSASSLSRSG